MARSEVRMTNDGRNPKPEGRRPNPGPSALARVDSCLLTPRRGVTLIEIMVVVAILAILLGIVIYISGNISDSAKIDQTKQIMETLTSTIEAYRDATGYWPPTNTDPRYCPNPPDCKWNVGQLYGPEQNPRDDRYHSGSVCEDNDGGCINQRGDGVFQIEYGKGDADDSNWVVESIEGLHYYLRHEPASKSMLSKVPEDRIKTKTVKVGGIEQPQLIRKRTEPHPKETSFVIVDPWDNNLRYRVDENTNNFVPFFWSAGPDEKWGTEDDICSYDR